MQSLESYSLDEIVGWRNAAHNRIRLTNRNIKEETELLKKHIHNVITKINRMERKNQKAIQWYKSLGKIVSRKIKGITFSDKVFE